MEQHALLIPERNIYAMRQAFVKAERAARKCGATLSVEEAWNYTLVQHTLNGLGLETVTERKFKAVAISGAAPKLDGWEFVAQVEHMRLETGEHRNLLYVSPGVDSVPAQYRTAKSHCDHCNTFRRRNNTFIVRNEAGEHKQVGRQCLRDFMGHKDPKDILAFYAFLSAFDRFRDFDDKDRDEPGGKQNVLMDRNSVLRATIGVISTCGWVSRQKSQESGGRPISTRSQVWSLFNPPLPGSGARSEWNRFAQQVRDHLPDDIDDQVSNILLWAREINTDNNDYLYNLNTLAWKEYWSDRHLGLGCSMVPAYRKATEKARKQEKSQAYSEYVGTPKKREEFTVTVQRLIGIDGYYGLTTLHIMEDPKGNFIKWFKSGEADLEEGHTYRVKATVKAHEEYEGCRQTIVQRLVELEEISPTP